MKVSSIVFATASLLLVEATPAVLKREQIVCPGQVTVSETFIGADSNVKLAQVYCPENTPLEPALSARQDNGTTPLDVCGATCDTNCFTPSGGGPNPNDCSVIADAMRFYSQNVNDTFLIGTGTNNTVVLTYSTCETFYVNQDPVEQSYCYSDWATIVDYIAPNCQSTQNAHGGNCIAADQQWFIQVQTN
ncbi:hypothetical protein EV361DRAFT_592972 [Lentinula raphanica]|uniref:Uncharacterized protein n=1 Tax=Lentinula raphanica TaxID=153919 RepID=A0AA38UE71_9AGAR|nr:hypothetical protein C8R42DRAFT_727579 [Lentinula raphanica]KAJ3758274.1 hypothetical protein EV360DRAFT_83209 [Lentinula raphanica]KAJ3767551.1 hypothetical protein FB446DRAFT_322014 [Lentinula raphanica]KAJ3827750.1 hypothetical protein F5880DRAFT_1609064 [Lentinula raphanica]KAJ3837810.1 hypothetical protein F5878DRAFT_661768 [Lentinula raphanica]